MNLPHQLEEYIFRFLIFKEPPQESPSTKTNPFYRISVITQLKAKYKHENIKIGGSTFITIRLAGVSNLSPSSFQAIVCLLYAYFEK